MAFGPIGGTTDTKDPIDRVNARPDFLIQVYPGPIGCPETVPKDAPPAFLIVADDDKGAAKVITRLFQAYRDAGASVEAHVFAHGGHGFNLGRRSKLASIKNWPARLDEWLADQGLLSAKAAEPAVAK